MTTTNDNLILVNQETDAGSSAQKEHTIKDSLMSFAPLVLIFGVFYFFLIRPQMKKQKEQSMLIKSAKKGDKIIFAGGLMGKIVKEKDDNTIIVEIAKDTEIEVMKSTIINIVNNKTQLDSPAPTSENKKSKKK